MVDKGTSWREKKLALLEWVAQLEDQSILTKLNEIRTEEMGKRQLRNAEYLRERVLASQKQIEEGRTIPHEKVKEDFLNGKL